MFRKLAHKLGVPTRDLLIIVILSIDIYYRVEWFKLHTALASLLSPLFGGE